MSDAGCRWPVKTLGCSFSIAALVLVGRSRSSTKPAHQRIAILRFENLSADGSADWMGRAFSDIVTTELSGAPGIYPIPATRFHNLDRAMGVRTVSAPGISSE